MKIHNNTASKDVWKVYDHITDDLFDDILTGMMGSINKDMDEYLEKVIKDEFQML